MEVLQKEIGPKDHRSADGKFSWEEVECLGACANAPMAAINDDYYEDLTPESLRQILDEFRAGRTPPPGSAIGRQATAPARRPADADRPDALRRLARQAVQAPQHAGAGVRARG